MRTGLLRICDATNKVVIEIPACAGKRSTPTFPWVFKPQRFKAGYSGSLNGKKLYYAIFFYKGLAIAGVNSVSRVPCSNGSVFIEKKYAKSVYQYAQRHRPVIRVLNR